AERLLRNRELLVETAQLDVVAGNRSDQRENHAIACVVAHQHVRQRRLAQTPDAPPEIDHPAHAKQGLIARLWIRKVWNECLETGIGYLLPLALAAVTDLRKQCGARLCEQSRRLQDIRSGDLDVAVVRERFGNQRVEHRIVVLLPPL